MPPQTIHVEPTEQEATFYEALRRTASERMEHFMAENNRISVLAEITKLRQACCDSSLVDSAVKIENSALRQKKSTINTSMDLHQPPIVKNQ